ncbi:MAG: HAMP domain-containing protein [Anaerolineae bacterium]|nr:HAMP domain-containing protein [Anaerolineae bacterium]
MRNSIRKRLTMAFVGLAVGPLLLIGVLLSWQNFNVQRQHALALQGEVAHRVSVEITAFFDDLENRLRLVSQVQGQQGMSQEQRLNILTELLFYEDVFEKLILLDDRGQEQLHLSRRELTPDNLDHHTGADEFIVPLSSGKTYYSSIWLNPELVEPLMVVAVPVFNVRTGVVEGVLVSEVRIKRIWTLITEVQVAKGQSVYVLNAQGKVVAHRNPSVVLSDTNLDLFDRRRAEPGQIGPGLAGPGLTGENAILTVETVRLGAQELNVVAEQTVSEAFAPARNSLYAIIFIIVATLMVAGSLSLWSARQIVRPIQAIAATAKAISTGDMALQVEVAGDDEVGILAKAFNRMTWQLRDMLSAEQERAAELRREIAERERVEKEIRYLQRLLQSITNSMPTTLIALDTEGRVLLWNPSAEQMMNLTAEQAQEQIAWEACPKLVRYRPLFEEVMSTGKSIYKHRDRLDLGGANIFWDVGVFPLRANQIEGCVLRIDDITQRVRLEEMMFQSTKMASIGSLAAGIAHEINNPLGAMMQSAQILQMAFNVEHPQTRKRLQSSGVNPENLERYLQERELQVYLDGIRVSGARAAKIVSDLLSFSHKEQTGFALHDLNAMIQQTLNLAATEYSLKRGYDFRDVAVVYELSPDLPSILCDRQQIQQVVLNLVRNAVQVMLENPDAAYVGYEPRLILRTSAQGNWVRLEIENNGPVIPQEVHSRLFEPFFTTKEVGEGTGLGLWVCWSIVVERHHGRIWAESGRERGALFVVELPVGGPTSAPDYG